VVDEPGQTPYERAGGADVVRRLVDRFYDLMESDPAVAPLRAMHAQDLGPMREKLGDFLIGWLGGPPLYFEREDSRCMGSTHRPFAIDNAIREQWLSCMHRALDESGIADDLQRQIRNALGQMTEAMRNR
jgi:hemoglobin